MRAFHRPWPAITLVFLVFFTQSARGEQTFEVLHGFDDNPSSQPRAALIEASDGSFYGTTREGGPGGGGMVFRLRPSFRRGDGNDDGDITDAVNVLEDLFFGPDPETDQSRIRCLEAMNVNDDADVDITDAINLLEALFLGKADRIVTPGLNICTTDARDSETYLGCWSYTHCEG